jgi:hypothetical protein
MVLAAIDPHGEPRERLAIQGVGRISNGDFTRYLFQEWGISLCLIRQTSTVSLGLIGKRSGLLPRNR